MLDNRPAGKKRATTSCYLPTLWPNSRNNWSSPGLMCLCPPNVVHHAAEIWPTSAGSRPWWRIFWGLVGQRKWKGGWSSSKGLELHHHFGSLELVESSQLLRFWRCFAQYHQHHCDHLEDLHLWSIAGARGVSYLLALVPSDSGWPWSGLSFSFFLLKRESTRL